VPGSERLLMCRVNLMVDEKVKTVSAEIVSDDEIDDRLDSQLKPVTDEYPVIEDIGQGQYKHYPVGSKGGKVGYITRPPKPVFGFTVVDDEEVYNNSTSTQMEWSDKYIDRVIFGAIAFLGISLDNQWLVQNGFLMKENKA
jgi:hypothetical protein